MNNRFSELIDEAIFMPPTDDEDEDEDEEEAYVMPFYDAMLLITLLIGNVFAYATIIRLNWT